MCQFQSLFCWMLFWKSKENKTGKSTFMFQSLFCWMLFWKMHRYKRCTPLTWVSILILLDVILEDEEIELSENTALSFNPYSVGCYSGSHKL